MDFSWVDFGWWILVGGFWGGWISDGWILAGGFHSGGFQWVDFSCQPRISADGDYFKNLFILFTIKKDYKKFQAINDYVWSKEP